VVNNERELVVEAACAFRAILGGLPEVQVETHFKNQSSDFGCDLQVDATSGAVAFRFAVQVKSRITPQVAFSACHQIRGMARDAIPVLYAPVISPRVAEIVREQDIGYVDEAGNCWLRNLSNHLLIERQGFRTERKETSATPDLFSTKSSRIIRALLSQPSEGWQVRQLAGLPGVKVSVGLVVKVKRALIEEGYGVEHGQLYLRDPVGLLNAWSQKYAGPVEQVPLYFRGDVAAAENNIRLGCVDHHLQYALGGMSAAWRLAPEVRYGVGTVYVENRGFDQTQLDQLIARSGGKRVDTGANLILWRPYDQSVFASVVDGEISATSALQTYLDLKRTPGRGEEAAKAIFEKHLNNAFQEAVKNEEQRHVKL